MISFLLGERRIKEHVIQMLGLRMESLVGSRERMGQVRITASLGISIVTVFSIFNMVTPGMALLGLAAAHAGGKLELKLAGEVERAIAPADFRVSLEFFDVCVCSRCYHKLVS